MDISSPDTSSPIPHSQTHSPISPGKQSVTFSRPDDSSYRRESYDRIYENDFHAARKHPLSTFSIDVDTASYANVRRFLNQGRIPDPSAVRIEELLNYFDYRYPQPEPEKPFAVEVEVTECPWASGHQLARIGLRGRDVEADSRPSCNLVFLIDVSGSMQAYNKLPLVKKSLELIVDQLDERDRVAIVVYASATRIELPSTPADRKSTILGSLGKLRAGGSTNGGRGIQLAYQIAQDNIIENGVNRVVLCTDGDFNVGTTGNSELVKLVAEKAKSGVTISVMGFGTGNLNDSMMEQISNRGNGNYGYIDTVAEARKLLVEELGGTLITIAKDVKIQVDFNPAYVKEYRLIGYENRVLKTKDFNDDKKDAGDIGTGHTVTALYEIVPVDQIGQAGAVVPSKYVAKTVEVAKTEFNDEFFTVRLRYKLPEEHSSTRFDVPVSVGNLRPLNLATDDMRFAAGVAEFGMVLRNSKFKQSANLEQAWKLANSGLGHDEKGYRKEFLTLIDKARRLIK